MGTFVITPELRAKFVDSMNTAANAASEMSNSFRMLSELAGNGADGRRAGGALQSQGAGFIF